MFKNKQYQNKNIIKIPKQTEQHNVKNVDIKPNTNNKNYENIRSIVENNDKPSITNSDVKAIKNKLNIL